MLDRTTCLLAGHWSLREGLAQDSALLHMCIESCAMACIPCFSEFQICAHMNYKKFYKLKRMQTSYIKNKKCTVHLSSLRPLLHSLLLEWLQGYNCRHELTCILYACNSQDGNYRHISLHAGYLCDCIDDKYHPWIGKTHCCRYNCTVAYNYTVAKWQWKSLCPPYPI